MSRLRRLLEVFEVLDTNNTGVIKDHDITHGLSAALGLDVAPADANKLIQFLNKVPKTPSHLTSLPSHCPHTLLHCPHTTLTPYFTALTLPSLTSLPHTALPYFTALTLRAAETRRLN